MGIQVWVNDRYNKRVTVHIDPSGIISKAYLETPALPIYRLNPASPLIDDIQDALDSGRDRTNYYFTKITNGGAK